MPLVLTMLCAGCSSQHKYDNGPLVPECMTGTNAMIWQCNLAGLSKEYTLVLELNGTRVFKGWIGPIPMEPAMLDWSVDPPLSDGIHTLRATILETGETAETEFDVGDIKTITILFSPLKVWTSTHIIGYAMKETSQQTPGA